MTKAERRYWVRRRPNPARILYRDVQRPSLLGQSSATLAEPTRGSQLQVLAGFTHTQKLAIADHRGLVEAVDAYLPGLPQVDEAVLAVAGPVRGDEVAFTNSPWRFFH
jgi:glucokinase